MTWDVRSPLGLSRIGFICSVGSTLAAQAWTAWAIPISLPFEVTQELRLMFWDLKGATFRPRSENILHRPATRVLLPEWEVVPKTTMNLVIVALVSVQVYLCFGMGGLAMCRRKKI